MHRNHARFSALTTLLAVTLFSSFANAEQIPVARFSHNDLGGWEEKSFLDNTRYTLVQRNGETVLKADTAGNASGMFREIEIDLNKTPYLNWSWQVDNIYQGNNERSKNGDDYPARVYVVVSGGLLFWQTRAINYVWSSNQSIGSNWDNAYTNKAKMLAVRSGGDATGQWLMEKRNIKEDLKQLFGANIDHIHAVAIMSDSDNHKQSARAYYGDIFFSAE